MPDQLRVETDNDRIGREFEQMHDTALEAEQHLNSRPTEEDAVYK